MNEIPSINIASEHIMNRMEKLSKKSQSLYNRVPESIRENLANNLKNVQEKTNNLKNATKEQVEQLKDEVHELTRSANQEYVREDLTARLQKNKKFEKLLINKNGFNSITAGDIGRIRALGENMMPFLLTDEEGDEITIDTKDLESIKNKKLLVNFGNNRSLNANIGLGNILPYDVKKVEITDIHGKIKIGTLGTKDSRNGRENRVGYYDESGKYIAIYTGYRIKILETSVTEKTEQETYEGLQKHHFDNIRINEMLEHCVAQYGMGKISKNDVNKILAEKYNDPLDQELSTSIHNRIEARNKNQSHIRDAYKDGMGSRDKFIGKFGWYIQDVIVKDWPNIPPHILVNLFDRESSPRGNFDPQAYNSSGAYGLGQMQDPAWADARKHAGKNYNKMSPYDQIHASASYLDMIMMRNKCNIEEAVVFYHMGPNVKTQYINTNNLEKLEVYKKSNPEIAKNMIESSWAGYMQAAKNYYLHDSGLLMSLDLYKNGTNLAFRLGDYVEQYGPLNTGKDSCGKAVGELLNRFGIEKLPQEGRDGKNWDNILDVRVKSGQFKKVPIGHPNEASSGAILVYDGSGEQGSEKNKMYGHVEIKGSNGNYYSYYESARAGGSAATGTKDPDIYKKLTGFTGYAYYPVTKDA